MFAQKEISNRTLCQVRKTPKANHIKSLKIVSPNAVFCGKRLIKFITRICARSRTAQETDKYTDHSIAYWAISSDQDTGSLNTYRITTWKKTMAHMMVTHAPAITSSSRRSRNLYIELFNKDYALCLFQEIPHATPKSYRKTAAPEPGAAAILSILTITWLPQKWLSSGRDNHRRVFWQRPHALPWLFLSKDRYPAL